MNYIKIPIFNYRWYITSSIETVEHLFAVCKSVLSACEIVPEDQITGRVIEVIFVRDMTDTFIKEHLQESDIKLASFPVALYENSVTGRYTLFCKSEFITDDLPFYLLSPLLMFIAYQHLDDGIVPVHGVSIVKKSDSILLIGKSGVGKSTCFKKASMGWRGGSDDLSLLQMGEDVLLTPYPTWSNFLPWGKEPQKCWDISQIYRIESIFLLAKGDDKVCHIEKPEAIMAIYTQLVTFISIFDFKEYKRDEYIGKMKKLFFFAEALVNRYDVKGLEHTLHGDYCKIIENYFRRESALGHV